MHFFLIFLICAVGLFATYGQADEDIEVKRGVYPYMAFVFYSDKTIVDRTGARLVRGAVLIRPDWLISSSLEDGETALAFPKETLVARLGAIRIDSRFTFNEDEEEQEREIVQIARPYNYSATEWWVADISLLKTLLPFATTASVGLAEINVNRLDTVKSCYILIYSAPNENRTEDKMLMVISIDKLLLENCGSNFIESRMMCAADSGDFKKESSFCEGNSGSPLICDRAVVGIQSYINDCKPPYLYQRLGYWDNFITCAVEDKCKEEQCGTICNIISKDPVNVPSQRTLLAEAKIYQEENVNHSSDEANLSTTKLKWLSPDGSKTITDSDFKNDVNTETTTSASSTVVYVSEKEIEISSEREMVSPTVTASTNEPESSTTTSSTLSTQYTTVIDTTQNTYKTEELMNKVEELKTFIDENINPDNTYNNYNNSVNDDQQGERSAASLTTKSLYVMSYLILFYSQFSFIHSF